MTEYTVDPAQLEELVKLINTSLPELSFVVVGETLRVGPTPVDQLKILEKLLAICEFKAKFSKCDVPSRIVWENESETSSISDKNRELEHRGDVVWLGPGMAVLTKEFLMVKERLQSYWKKLSEELFKAIAIENPALWSPELTDRSEYLSDFPHEAMFILGAKKNYNDIDSIRMSASSKLGGLNHEAKGLPMDALRVLGVLQPSVCTSCYAVLAQLGELENQVYTTENRVFRNEGANSLDRLASFTVRDLIAVGNEQFVQHSLDNFRAAFQEFLIAIDLSVTLELAHDPFFASSAAKIVYQEATHSKMEFQSPFASDGSKVAIGSVNNHGNLFGTRFGMQINGLAAFSGCMGIGFDRLTYVLFCQKGIEVVDWPDTTRTTLGLQ